MKTEYDVIIVGGGIMGLLGAYEVVRAGGTVALLEKATVGNKNAGSSGLTRSLRTDYQNPVYAQLARQSRSGWLKLEKALGQKLTVQTGCLNMAQAIATGTLTYAERAAEWLRRDGGNPLVLRGESQVTQKFPQFRSFNYAVYEESAGLGFAGAALQALGEVLHRRSSCQIFENTSPKRMRILRGQVQVRAGEHLLTAPKLVIAAGLGTPEVLKGIAGCNYRLTLTPDRPAECVYYIPKNPKSYTDDALPIFACLDKGIYGHPIVQGLTKGVKIGRYIPPASVNQLFQTGDQSIEGFVRTYLPELAATATLETVTDTDQCAYDMTPDEGFVVGPLAITPQIFVAAGFCGTGYKFAPVVAQLMCDFVIGQPFRYDIDAFNPERFNV